MEHAIDAVVGEDVTEHTADAAISEDANERAADVSAIGEKITEDVIGDVTGNVTRLRVDGGPTDATPEHAADGGISTAPTGCGCRAQGPTGATGSWARTLIVAALAGVWRRPSATPAVVPIV